jgi:hypothetical protein
LGIVIGRHSSYLADEAEALASIAGYVLVNDVSEREWQIERSGQWSKGKSAETFNPAGPWLVTPDEIADVNSLGMWLDVSGVRRQTGSTATMVFDATFIVQYLSQFLVLEPGDLINTGTPPGVGIGFKPPVFLQPGDVMELGIDGLEAVLRRTGGSHYPKSGLVENVEFFIVAAIVILGLRAFYVQPFKIPTNSMWPSYYGMTGQVYATRAEEPSAPRRAFDLAAVGASARRVDAPVDGEVMLPLGGGRDVGAVR